MVGLTEEQADRLLSQDISMATKLSYMDDTNLMARFDEGRKPTTSTGVCLLPFCAWVREQQAMYGYGNIDSTHFTDEQRDTILVRKRGTYDISLYQLSSKEAKEPEPGFGKIHDWQKEKREFMTRDATKQGYNGVPLAYLLLTDDNDNELVRLSDISNQALNRNANPPTFTLITITYFISWSHGQVEELLKLMLTFSKTPNMVRMYGFECLRRWRDAKITRIQQADALIDSSF